MTALARLGLLLLLPVVGCSSRSTSAGPDAATDAAGLDAGTDLRGARYCEILLATMAGADVQIQVYSTVGLSDCPEAAWSALDEDAIQADTGADLVILNGPRYWTINSAAGSTLIDPTPRTLGGLEMRQAGAITLPVADLATAQQPYTRLTITRDSEFVFWGGQTVFELVDAAGHVYTMQSFSVQEQEQTEATLPDLGAALTLPAGWAFRTRTLDDDLVLRSVDHMATVVQDERRDTYLQSQ